MEPAVPLEPIGASLLESFTQNQNNSNSASGSGPSQNDHDLLEVIREKGFPPSFLSVALGEEDGHGESLIKSLGSRILLQGPSSSGRSSLTMEFALEMAARAPCLCKSISGCKCTPVVFLRASNQYDDFFPLRCQRIENCTSKEHQQQQQHEQPTYSNQNASNANWNRTLLRRIMVHHFANLTDCLYYILSLAGKSAHEQPFGAIILEDLDLLVSHGPLLAGDKDGTSQVMHLLALLLDTANHLTYSPPLVVTMNTNLNFPLDSWMASFFDTKLTLQEETSNSNSRRETWNGLLFGENESMVVRSCWSANFSGEGQNGQQQTMKRPSLEYIICRDNRQEEKLFWRTCA